MATQAQPKVTKNQFIGPIITKKQRAECLDWFNSKPSHEDIMKQLELEQYETMLETLSLMDLSNEQIEKVISIVKVKRTSTDRSGPSTGVGKRCRELITQGLTNKEVLTQIKIEFPNNNTSYSCVAWYRNDMKK